jgi:hypothetical protein
MNRTLWFFPSLALLIACTDTPPPSPMALDPHYGVEPSPFFPSATNELEAISKQVKDIRDRLDVLLTDPPDPYQPVVGRLSAMTKDVHAQTGHLKLVLASVPAGSFDGAFGYETFVSALDGVGTAASELAERAGVEPTPFAPESRLALAELKTAAGEMAQIVTNWFAGGCDDVGACPGD